MYLGDFNPGRTVSRRFNTHTSAGVPSTFSGSQALHVYKQGSSTPSPSGITLTTNYNSQTGLNNVVVDTSVDSSFYANGFDFDVAVATGMVDGTNVSGVVVASFSLGNRPATTGVNLTGWLGTTPSGLQSGRVNSYIGAIAAGVVDVTAAPNLDAAITSRLAPTVAARTLDVSVAGNAGIDWGNLENPGTTNDLYGTTINSASPSSDRSVLWTGVAPAGGASTVTLDSGASSTDDFYNGAVVVLWSGQGSGQAPRLISDYVGSTRVATIAPQWVTTPASGTAFALLGTGPADVYGWRGEAPLAMQSGRVNTYVGATTGTLTYDLNGSMTGNVGGKVLGSGAATITGVGARAYDGSGNALPTATGIASAVFDRARASHNTAGSFGETFTSLNARMPGAGTIAVSTDVPATGSIAAAVRDITNTSPAASGFGWMVKKVADRAPTSGTLAVAGDAMALTSGERTTMANALLDLSNGTETSLTVRQTLRGLASILLGDTEDANTANEIFKAAANSGTTRVSTVVDESGNRVVTLNL